MTDKLIVKGQALSTWPLVIGAATSIEVFAAPAAGAFVGAGQSTHPIRIQGFKWTGGSVLTVSDAAGTVLYSHASTPNIYPVTASGSYGLVCNAPLTLTTAGAGGTLLVYGEVL